MAKTMSNKELTARLLELENQVLSLATRNGVVDDEHGNRLVKAEAKGSENEQAIAETNGIATVNDECLVELAEIISAQEECIMELAEIVSTLSE